MQFQNLSKYPETWAILPGFWVDYPRTWVDSIHKLLIFKLFFNLKITSNLRIQNVKEFFQNFKFEIENFKIKIFLKRSKLKIFEKFFHILFPWVILEF